MSIYLAPLEEDEDVFEDLGKCPKCGRVGCTCGPDCSCSSDDDEEARAILTEQKRQNNLIQSFEE
tara:strand:- start:947 stop:1141 length:195 start_codon:yes stop_codon:yes gene_type:complete